LDNLPAAKIYCNCTNCIDCLFSGGRIAFSLIHPITHFPDLLPLPGKNKKMKLTKENFECVKDDNSEEEENRQWENSQVVFDEFEEYLRTKNYSDKLVQRQLEYSSFFVMSYFFVYEDVLSVLETDDTTIRKFLGNWYIRKNLSPNLKEMKEILSALFDFFEFLFKRDLITDEQFEIIKAVCKDKDWFENRLKTYKTTDTKGFKTWIDEYDYDW
jgi:hypothetical protein